jgi:hypothetical protein
MTPVVLVPGYLGTRLRHRESGRMVWGTIGAFYRTRPEELAGECELAGPVDAITVIPKLWTYPVYSKLLRALGDRLVTFEYDWRASHADTGRQLARFLDRFDGPVHAIAHSTGGYVLDYCVRYGDAAADGAVEPAFSMASRFASIIHVGVPWLGTVAAIRDATIGWRVAPFGRRFPAWMVQRFASVHEAVPTWDGAWRGARGEVVAHDPFARSPGARAFREALGRGPRWAPVRTRLVVCNSIRTRAGVVVTERGLDFDRHWGPGDGTVPIGSALPERALPPHVTAHFVKGRHRYLLANRAVLHLLKSWLD